jgi:CrcB protein
VNYLLVFIGGGIGSILRYGVGKVFSKSFTQFPIATLISNLTACLIFALVIYYGSREIKSEWLTPFLIVGLCGGFSTFSTFSFENFQLYNHGNYGLLLLNIFISIIPGILCFYLVSNKL